MRNIQIVQTNKTIKDVGDLVRDKFGTIHIFSKNDSVEYGKTTKHFNIHITSEEEIKLGDWVYCTKQGFIEVAKQEVDPSEIKGNIFMKKIIMSTQEFLINDGVQAISKDFLEWFVKNPDVLSVKIRQLAQVDCSNKLFNMEYQTVIPVTETIKENCDDTYQQEQCYNEVFEQLAKNDYLSDDKEYLQKDFLEYKKIFQKQKK
jgi:hypothetical protein